MRTNIDIDDELLAKAMRAGPYTTKKETVEAGLRLRLAVPENRCISNRCVLAFHLTPLQHFRP